MDSYVTEELKQSLESLTKALKNILDEREALIKAFDSIRQSFEGREWLMEGRGCYPYNDDRYKEEVKYIMDEFQTIQKDLWKQIKSKSFDYRKSIEKPLLDKINELEKQVKELQNKQS